VAWPEGIGVKTTNNKFQTKELCEERHKNIEDMLTVLNKNIETTNLLATNHMAHMETDMDLLKKDLSALRDDMLIIKADSKWTNKIAAFAISIASAVGVAFIVKILIGGLCVNSP
jgi:hypothetical protein